MSPTPLDVRIREAALAWCETLRARWGDAVPAAEARRFPFEGGSIFLYGQQGIFKPRELTDGPLSIRTSLTSRYQDDPGVGGEQIRYDFSPRPYENDGLKRLRDAATPLIYLVQVKPKPRPEYLTLSPVFVTGWDDAARVFHVEYQPALGALSAQAPSAAVHETSIVEKRYALHVYRSRLHQAHFRRAVLEAYRTRCAICELRVRPLLDGAHIVRDADARGEPVVQNGMSLCALHHRAYDRRIVLVDEDYRVRVDASEIPARDATARAALTEHDGRRILLPRDRGAWPDPERLRHTAAGA